MIVTSVFFVRVGSGWGRIHISSLTGEAFFHATNTIVTATPLVTRGAAEQLAAKFASAEVVEFLLPNGLTAYAKLWSLMHRLVTEERGPTDLEAQWLYTEQPTVVWDALRALGIAPVMEPAKTEESELQRDIEYARGRLAAHGLTPARGSILDTDDEKPR